MKKIILVDVPLAEDLRAQLVSFDGVDLLRYRQDELAGALWGRFLSPALAAHPETLVVVVEGSGEDIWRMIDRYLRAQGEEKTIRPAYVFSKRIAPRNAAELINGWHEPYWIAGEIPTSRFLMQEVTQVILIDDVVGSGMTLRKIKAYNAWKFPLATWRAVAAVGRAEAKAKMPWEAVHIVESPGGKVPINSLSTLLQNPALAEDYARRNFSDHQGFLEVLLEIKQSA